MRFQRVNLQTVTGYLARLARLDLSVFEEIRADAAATAPALLVMVAASFLAGLGSWLWWYFRVDFDNGEAFLKTFILGSILQAAVWFLWVYFAYQILSRGYGARADFYEMLRTMGFAFAPMGLTVLMAISVLAVPFGVIPLAATVVFSQLAIQATSTAPSQQVLAANLAGFAVFALVMGILANVGEMGGVGGIAPGLLFFALD